MEGTKMKLLIVIPTWNYPEYSTICVASIRKTAPPIDYRIFMVDNGSSEENFTRIEALKSEDDIEIVRNPINSLYNARNRGIRKAVEEGYDFVCCIDNDIIFLPGCLKNMLDVCSGPSVALVSPMMTYRGGAGWKHLYAYLPPEKELRIRETMKTGCDPYVFSEETGLLEWYENHWKHPDGIGQQVKLTDGTCNIFNTKALRTIGYIDEKLGLAGRRWEQDYGYRILQAGYRWMVCKSSFIYHFNLSSVTVAREDHYTWEVNLPDERMEAKYGKKVSEEIGPWTREAIYLGQDPREKNEYWQEQNELCKWIDRGTMKPEWQKEMTEHSGERSFIDYRFPGEVRGIPHDHIKRYELARDLIHQNKMSKVLDLGCGSGYGALIINAQDYMGWDIEPVALDFALHNVTPYMLPAASFIVGDAAEIHLPDESIDCCCCFEMIEHVDEEKATQILGECKRLLKPNGMLLISNPLIGPEGELHSEYHKREYALSEFIDNLQSNIGKVEKIFHQHYDKKDLDSLKPFSEENPRCEFSPPAMDEGIYVTVQVRK